MRSLRDLKRSIPSPEKTGLLNMEHRLACNTQYMLNDFAANHGLRPAYDFTHMFELRARLARGGKLTGDPAAAHVSNTASGMLFHKYLDAFLEHSDAPAVRRAARSLGPAFGGDKTDAALVEKMQAALGWENAAKMGLSADEIAALQALNPDELRAAQQYLKDGHIDPALFERLKHFHTGSAS
jgi:hypothetical protein